MWWNANIYLSYVGPGQQLIWMAITEDIISGWQVVNMAPAFLTVPLCWVLTWTLILFKKIFLKKLCNCWMSVLICGRNATLKWVLIDLVIGLVWTDWIFCFMKYLLSKDLTYIPTWCHNYVYIKGGFRRQWLFFVWNIDTLYAVYTV